MWLRLQVALYLLVLFGLTALAQALFASRTLRGVLRGERSAEAAAALTRVLPEITACRGDPACTDDRLKATRTAHALQWIGWYEGTRRIAGDSPEILGHEPATVSVATPDGTIVARPGRARDLEREKTAQRGLLGGILLTAAAAFAASLLLLERAVLRPIQRLSEVAERAPRPDAVPFGSPGTGPVLRGLARTLDQMVQALGAERARTATQLAEIEAANRDLAAARDSLTASEKLATVGRLAAGVAHEVGNPLSAVVGYLDLARSRAGSGETREVLDRIEAEIRRIDGTVRGLLSFARPDAIRLGPTSVAASVEAAVRLASMPSRMKGVDVVRELPADLPPVVAEEHRLAQVLVNLLLNAADAMQGRGSVEIRARLGDGALPARRAGDPPSGLRVVLTVADSGPGIPQEHVSRVFDPFFTTKDPGHGTGLGLSICHGILESFGGEIQARNRPEGGAEFALMLRVAADPGSAPPG